MPYSNRIRRGRFDFAGGEHVLRLSAVDPLHAIHGEGWAHPWEILETTANEAAIVYRHEPAPLAWPFRFRAVQRFRLAGDRLTVEIAMVNEESVAVPAGIGLHPFFPDAAAATLQARLGAVWLVDDERIPAARAPVPGEWDFSGGRPLRDVRIDNCFDGWDGAARIAWPADGLALELRATAPFDHLVVYRPAEFDFFCVEPASHANDALNLAALGVPDTGLRLLAPGARLAGRVELRLIAG